MWHDMCARQTTDFPGTRCGEGLKRVKNRKKKIVTLQLVPASTDIDLMAAERQKEKERELDFLSVYRVCVTGVSVWTETAPLTWSVSIG